MYVSSNYCHIVTVLGRMLSSESQEPDWVSTSGGTLSEGGEGGQQISILLTLTTGTLLLLYLPTIILGTKRTFDRIFYSFTDRGNVLFIPSGSRLKLLPYSNIILQFSWFRFFEWWCQRRLVYSVYCHYSDPLSIFLNTISPRRNLRQRFKS